MFIHSLCTDLLSPYYMAHKMNKKDNNPALIAYDHLGEIDVKQKQEARKTK